jgi:hypothetical protein
LVEISIVRLVISNLVLLSLAAATVTARQAQPSGRSPSAGSPAPGERATDAPSVAFHWGAGRLLATVDRELLETDFVVDAEIVAVTPALPGVVGVTHPGSIPERGTRRASGALRLRRTGDSVVLSEYAGTARGKSQYRRRAVTPILRVTPAGALLIDAAPLWAAVDSGAVDEDEAALRPAGDFAEVGPRASPTEATAVPAGPATVVRPEDGYLVGYRLGVLRLPMQPMRPRLHDPRLTFLNTAWNNSVATKPYYILRWRLEKRDPAAELSEVVQPIVIRITDTVPAQWVPYVKRGAERWNSLFEAAGFRHAIVVQLPGAPPTTEREITIEWTRKGLENTAGNADPKADPRTGEVLSATVTMREAGLLQLSQNALVGGGLDPRTRLPLPDTLVGSLLEWTVTHEVGHALGFDHNFRGAGLYPTDSLRRPSFARRMGHMTSIMAWTDINYVAQPEDAMAFADRLPRLGPYDRWALVWGYRAIPQAATPEAELPVLEQWRAAQDTAPYLQPSLGKAYDRWDPKATILTIGNDPFQSLDYGLRHLLRLAEALEPWQDTVAYLPPSLIAKRWDRLLDLVASLVGGTTPQAPYPPGLAGIALRPVDAAGQARALRVVLARMFYGQDDLVRKYFTATPTETGTPSLVLFDTVAAPWTEAQLQGYQVEMLATLVRRLVRLSKLETLSATDRAAIFPPLCRELATLNLHLTAAAARPGAVHAQKLRDKIAPAFRPAGNVCG